jgi:lipopolysaccharide transport system ATP-binding protein
VSGPLLRLDRVSKTYPPTVQAGQRFRAFWQLLTRGSAVGGTRVLEEISFEVPPGQSMAVVGANGAGKSTLLKIITGFWPPPPAPSSRAAPRRPCSSWAPVSIWSTPGWTTCA